MNSMAQHVGHRTTAFGQGRPVRPYELTRRTLDVSCASFGLLLVTPLLCVLVLLVRLDGGTSLFRHRRVGPDGRSFGCLKLRTMHVDADARLAACLVSDPLARREWQARQKLSVDPRITPLGRVLRRTSLDELPQLINVLRGEMSLIGPRPVPPDELARYGRGRSAYLACPPGITGLWQVSARRGVSYRHRVAYDRFYAEHRGPALDALIAWRTVRVVLSGSGE